MVNGAIEQKQYLVGILTSMQNKYRIILGIGIEIDRRHCLLSFNHENLPCISNSQELISIELLVDIQYRASFDFSFRFFYSKIRY